MHSTNGFETKPSETIKALIYCRVSSKRQKEEGSGLDSQAHRCRQYAAQRGYKVEAVFPDSYSGGGDFLQRPAMKALLAHADQNASTQYVVIFDDLKRFARDTVFHWGLRQALESRNMVPECLNFNFDDSPAGRFIETIQAAHNQLEREENRQQTINRQKARLERGLWAFTTKKGYKVAKDPQLGKILVRDEPHATHLAHAISGYANGIYKTKTDACRFLCEQGFWHTSEPSKLSFRFAKIVRDPFYAGYIEYKPWNVTRRKGLHEPIISSSTHLKATQKLEGGASNKRARQAINPDFPLRGHILCADCDLPFTAAWSRGCRQKYAYYFCRNKACPGSGVIPKEKIEREFKDLLGQQTLSAEMIAATQAIMQRLEIEMQSRRREEQSRALRKIKKVQDDMANMMKLIRDASSDTLRSVYESELEKLALKSDALQSLTQAPENIESAYRTTLDKVLTLMKDPYAAWSNADANQKQLLFYAFFLDKIPYSKDRGYRTTECVGSKRLFEDFVAENTHSVRTTRNSSNSFVAYLSKFRE